MSELDLIGKLGEVIHSKISQLAQESENFENMAEEKNNKPNIEILCLSTDDESEEGTPIVGTKIPNNQQKRQRKYDKRMSQKKKTD